MKTKHMRPLARHLARLCVLSAAATPLAAQDSSGSGDEDLVLLSPFTVETTKDVGYLAQNSLAGSRLNTSLMDTGAAISVLTPEFLKDLGATNMKDVILFANNSVPEYGDSASNYNGNPMVGNSEWQLRIRGLNASYARNYFETVTPTDFYNVSRIDQSRGPNAILFGFGAPGGIVNTSTKQASLVPIDNEFGLTVGSWRHTRETVDSNVILVDNVLAIRVNAVNEEQNSWRQYENYQSKRVDLAATWKVTKNSTLRAEFENGHVKDAVARTWLLIDQTLAWREAGSPLYDDAQWGSDIVAQTWSSHIVYNENDGTVLDWNGRPYTYSGSRNWSHLAMTSDNLKLFPARSNPAGPGAQRRDNYHTYSLWYEITPVENLNVELAYNHQKNDFHGYDPNAGNLVTYSYLGDASSLMADASKWTPETWGANPYAGQYYLENNWTRRTVHEKVDNYRATASYELDFGVAGRHRLAAMFSRKDRKYENREESEVLNSGAAKAESDENRLFRRYYITPGDASSIRVPTWETPVSYKGVGTIWVPDQEINNADQTLDTMMGALQSYFLNDRIVTTMGIRHDHFETSTDPTVRGADGILGLAPSARKTYTFNADTFSLGVVGHVTDWFSLYANHSNNRDLPNVSQHLINSEIPPMAEGTGTDLGAKLNLFGGKLYATINYYKTDFKNVTEWGDIQAKCTTLNNRVLDKFVADGIITQTDATSRYIDADSYLSDRKSDGWEFEVIANPDEHWRLTTNFSISHVKYSNIMSEVVSWAKQAEAFWLSKGSSGYLLGQGDWDTLGNQIGWMEDYITGRTAFNDRQARGEREYGASSYLRYLFTDGFLKGFYIGGGVRYQSANSVDYDGSTLIKGNDLFLVDAMAGYDFTIKGGDHPVKASIQLNISNLLDNDDYQIYTVAWWNKSIPERIGLQEPRKLTLSGTISF
jgi:outer membrane receptor protein involved in Fe transport